MKLLICLNGKKFFTKIWLSRKIPYKIYMVFHQVNVEIPLVVMELIVIVYSLHYVNNSFKFKIILLTTSKFSKLSTFFINKRISIFSVGKCWKLVNDVHGGKFYNSKLYTQLNNLMWVYILKLCITFIKCNCHLLIVLNIFTLYTEEQFSPIVLVTLFIKLLTAGIAKFYPEVRSK